MKFLARFLGLFGVNPLSLISIYLFPRYVSDFIKFNSRSKQRLGFYPILSDYKDSAGVMSGHYFHQDLYVAQKIHSANPINHLDVGSRIDGFVAHLATFRRCQVADIRPLESKISNISFIQVDFTKPFHYPSDSISCLHAIEHFGLGRYGDQIDPRGHYLGFQNLVNNLEVGGKLYISFPIASKFRIEFNAHRVFTPLEIFDWPGAEQLELDDFAWVDDKGDLRLDNLPEDLLSLKIDFGCGIYTFRKK